MKIADLPHLAAVTIIALLALAMGLAGSAQAAPLTRAHHDPVTISMWYTPPAAGTPKPPISEKTLVHQFEHRNPGIHVKLINEPGAATSTFETLLRSSEVAGNTPDMTFLFAGGQILQNARYLLPLNKYISPKFRKSLYIGWRFATAGFKAHGPIYGVPFGAGYWYFVYYNKSLFDKAQVKAPTSPMSWPQLITLAKKIKSHGITPFEFGEKQGYFGAWTEDALISSYAGTNGLLRMYDGKKSLDSPAIIKAYRAWHELYADGLTNRDAPTLDDNAGMARFSAGKAAMTITGGFANQGIEQGLGKTKVGIFPVPSLPGAKYRKVLSGGPNNDYVIFKTSKHPAQVMKWIKFLVSTRVQKADNGGQLPNTTSYVAGSQLTKQDPLIAEEYQFIRTKHYALAEAFDNVMPGSIDSYWYQTNTAVFGGQQSPTQAAKNLQAQMASYLESSKAP